MIQILLMVCHSWNHLLRGLCALSCVSRGCDSSVGIATGYRLDGLGIESRWWRDFPHLSRLALGPTHPPAQCVAILLLSLWAFVAYVLG
jgi:hypothetical protein